MHMNWEQTTIKQQITVVQRRNSGIHLYPTYKIYMLKNMKVRLCADFVRFACAYKNMMVKFQHRHCRIPSRCHLSLYLAFPIFPQPQICHRNIHIGVGMCKLLIKYFNIHTHMTLYHMIIVLVMHKLYLARCVFHSIPYTTMYVRFIYMHI